jgi:ElaB/YqjD/DUF883 family membrane-anchored ribosome-binding protein
MAEDKTGAAAVPAEKPQAGETIDAAEAAIREGLDEAHRYLKREWSERPVTVVAAALGAGILIGLLLGGRR